MSFFTAINCIDGRTHLPVIEYLTKKFKVQFIDLITQPGPNLILSNQTDKHLLDIIIEKINISIKAHDSQGIAITGHYDCAGNPVEEQKHIEQIIESAEYLKTLYPDQPVIGLWIDDNWEVQEICNL